MEVRIEEMKKPSQEQKQITKEIYILSKEVEILSELVGGLEHSLTSIIRNTNKEVVHPNEEPKTADERVPLAKIIADIQDKIRKNNTLLDEIIYRIEL